MKRAFSGLIAAGALVAPAVASPATVKLVSPNAGSVVQADSFKLVLQLGGFANPVRVKLESDHPDALPSATAGNGRVTLMVSPRQSGIYHFTATAGSIVKNFALTLEPPVTPVVADAEQFAAPGCTSCVVHDPRGDNFGAAPDLKDVAVQVKAGLVTVAIHTYDAYAHGENGGAPCLAAYVPTPGNQHQFGIGYGCGGSRGPVRYTTSSPNANTVVYRFRASQVRSPFLLIDAWVLYPGDQLKDAAPSYGGKLELRGSRVPYCVVKIQLRREPARDYVPGKSRCG